MSLQRIELQPSLGPLPQSVAHWIEAAGDNAKSFDCFEYIPSCAELLHGYLKVIPGKRFCEWGSGGGIGVGIAALLGFSATGIEVDAGLAQGSQEILKRFGINADVIAGSYHEVQSPAEIVFVYCWPGQSMAVRERFKAVMPHGSWLLIADGAERFSAFFHCRADG